ncbi:MAG: hypothetical protein ACTSYB_09350, partial [Candidatus Helarchaeota archaeon]
MKKDPLGIIISLIYNLNLLEEGATYNINQLQSLKNFKLHWVTIHKYLKIITLIQKYAPNIKLKNSKVSIIYSPIYQHLTLKEKFIIHLFNKRAFDPKTAVIIPPKFRCQEIYDSVGYLYQKTRYGKYYLNEAGIEVFNSIKISLSNLIFNEKEINEIFFNKELETIELENSNQITSRRPSKPDNFISYKKVPYKLFCKNQITQELNIPKLEILNKDLTNNEKKVFEIIASRRIFNRNKLQKICNKMFGMSEKEFTKIYLNLLKKRYIIKGRRLLKPE